MNYNIEELSNEAIALLSDLINIPSYSKEENAAADFLEKHIEIKGYTAIRKDNNVWIMSPGFDLSRPTLLLNSHIDTVRPVNNWTYNPHQATIVDNKLFGLGSNDAGASLVCLLQAFYYLSMQKQHYNLIFAASAEEEISGKNGVESLLKELPKIDFAIVGEPTQMHLAVAEKGLMVLDCVSQGIAGHAARNEGENAIYKAMDDIAWFQNFRFEKESELLGPVKMSVTQINAGTQHNVVPDQCKFVVDIRSNEMYSNEQILEIIKKHVKCSVQARSTRLSSSATPLSHPLVSKAKTMGRKLYGSPTLSDQALMKCQSVKIGPRDSARSHTANEYIELAEISHGIEMYIELLNGLKI